MERNMGVTFLIRLLTTLALIPAAFSHKCEDTRDEHTEARTLKYKGFAMASLFAASAVGVFLPLLCRKLRALRPGGRLWWLIRTFDQGATIYTSFVIVLRYAFGFLTSPCLADHPWTNFSFTGFFALLAATAATYYELWSHRRGEERRRLRLRWTPNDVENTRTDTHHHHHLRHHRLVLQELEFSTSVFMVVISVALGTLESPESVLHLVAPLSIHQFLEGIGLATNIMQANIRGRIRTVMIALFTLVTPIGIAMGIGISSAYNANNPTIIVIQGLLSSASAGILIYTTLNDISTDFMGPALQSNRALFLGATASLLMGIGCMAAVGLLH